MNSSSRLVVVSRSVSCRRLLELSVESVVLKFLMSLLVTAQSVMCLVPQVIGQVTVSFRCLVVVWSDRFSVLVTFLYTSK